MGTPDFSVPCLLSLIKNYNVKAVVTQPDKKVGRQQELSQSPIKKIALTHKIAVLQPDKVKGNAEFMEQIKSLQPDLIVVVAYGFILPQELLEIPKLGAINVHASLLPKYRGASPIQTAILNNEQETGVTIMLINEKMDEGDILAQVKIKIDTTETFTTLHDKFALLGANLLLEILPQYLGGQIKPQPQDDSQATYCQLITKEMGKINWRKSAQEIDRQIRAFTPWPGAFTFWNGKQLKISAVMVSTVEPSAEIGKVFKFNDGIGIKCGKGVLEIIELQLESKKTMNFKEFLNGNPQIIGSLLS